jgi:hypothetical protein
VRLDAAAPAATATFLNAGQEELRGTGYVEPPYNLAYFLTAIYGSQRSAGGSRPSPFDAPFLAHRYRSEYADAPEPVKR